MIKPNFSPFTQARLIYVDKPAASSVESGAASEVKKQVTGVEREIIEKRQSPEVAAGKAKFMIGEIVKAAQEKLKNDWELRKNPNEYAAFLARLDKMAREARAEITKNMERYKKIAAYVQKKAETAIVMERNKRVLEREIAGHTEVAIIPVLQETYRGLNRTKWDLDGMFLEGTGMEEDRNTFVGKLEAQMELFPNEVDRILLSHREQIAMAEKHVEALTKINEQGRFWAGNPPYSDSAAREDWQRAIYLQRFQREVTAIPEAAELAVLAQTTLERLTPALIEWDEKHSSNGAFAEREKLLAQFRKAERNYENARENFEKISGKKDVTNAEVSQARSWLTGAEQASNEQLTKMENAVAAMQRKNGEAPVDLEEERIYLASIRQGSTTVEYGATPEEKPAPVMIAEKEKAEARPEGRKKAS